MKLSIKEPCHEDWNKMKIGLYSRHCEICDKGVVDFTTKTRAEIITYILSNPAGSVCGRMHRDQFDFYHEDIPVLIETLQRQNTPNPFLILALVCLSLASCKEETQTLLQKKPILKEQIQTKIDPDTASVDLTDDIQRKLRNKTCDPFIEKQGEVVIQTEP